MITELNVTAVVEIVTDMGLRDPFGNAIRILRRAKVAQKATA